MGNNGKRYFCLVLLVIFGSGLQARDRNNVRPRAREAGIASGVLTPGKLNSITDVEGVKVGHVTLIVATDAPLLSRNLKRLAKRAVLGLARTGSVMNNSSGDYVIAFSTAEALRRGSSRKRVSGEPLPNSKMDPLFRAVVEATEEAVYNSLFKATAVTGRDGHFCEALPIDRTLEICRKHKTLE